MKFLRPPFARSLAAATALATATALAETPPPPPAPVFGLVLHGGAGVIERSAMTPELEAQYRAQLTAALDAGYALLASGGTALDAVTRVVTLLEDSPLFNAGRGAVFNADGRCELDAAIMDGRTLAAGAIAGVQHIRNPVTLARDVMEKSPHVMLIGAGAEAFAQSLGTPLVPNEYFQTEPRRQQLERARAQAHATTAAPAHPPGPALAPAPADAAALAAHFQREAKYGTVGCAALDRHGNLAAATSTGGMTNKQFGRVGDVPVIGAGTYANNATCAVSATGWGEFFIRATVAHDLSARLEYQHAALGDAARATLARVAQLGGNGGVVAIDARGVIALEFNSPGMYRAARTSVRAPLVAIYGDEPRE